MKIFDLVEKFAGYGFNKSHSAAYALVSYQTLWLKAHYPAEFMAAVMTADMDNTDKVVGLVDECWRMGLKILPPDINSGLYHFHVNDDGEIVYGIGVVVDVNDPQGRSVVQAILKGTSISVGERHEMMPAFGSAYSDEEVAAVANFVVGHFGDKQGKVTAKQVAEQRKQ